MSLFFREIDVVGIISTDCVVLFFVLFMIDSEGVNAKQWFLFSSYECAKHWKHMLIFMNKQSVRIIAYMLKYNSHFLVDDISAQIYIYIVTLI